MAEYKMGFIGTGNMGSALARAAAKSGERMLLANRTPEKAQRLAERLGCTAADNEMVINSAAYLFLGAKPQDMFTLLDVIAPLLAARKTPFVLVSMAAGITLQELADHTSPAYPILRIMPNTPVAIGEGMTYYTPNANVTQAQLDAFLSGIAGCGQFDRLSEPLLDAGSAVSGCGGALCSFFAARRTVSGRPSSRILYIPSCATSSGEGSGSGVLEERCAYISEAAFTRSV